MTSQSKHYQNLEDDANAQLKAMYGDDLQGSSEAEHNEDGGDQSEDQELDASTPDYNETEPEKDNASEPMVSETRYKDAVRAMNAAQQEAAALRKENQTLQENIDSLQELLESAAAEPSDSNNNQSDDDYDFDSALEELPKLVKQNKESEKRIAQLEQQISSMKTTTDKIQQSDIEDDNARYWKAIADSHSDYETVHEEPDFQVWYANQTDTVKKMASSAVAQEVINALDLYRAKHPKDSLATDKARNATTRQDKLEAARNADTPSVKSGNRTPATTDKRTFTNAEIAKMSREEFARNEKAIDAAMARGDVI